MDKDRKGESKRKMKKAKSHPVLKYRDESDCRRSADQERVSVDEDTEIDSIWERMSCMALRKRESFKRDGESQGISPEKNGLQWRQEQKIRAAKLEKQLKTRCALEDLLDEQLNHFHASYKRTASLIRLKDIAQFLVPKDALPQEMAAVWWLGDWRPSSILELIRSLPRSSPSFSSNDDGDIGFGAEQTLSQLIHEMQIEEAVLDEQMAEIQATCVLHLPFSHVHHSNGHEFELACIQSEFEKIHGVIVKAQHLRFKALELAVRKVLSQTDAAEFFIAFDAIQDLIHQIASDHKIRRGPVSLPIK